MKNQLSGEVVEPHPQYVIEWEEIPVDEWPSGKAGGIHASFCMRFKVVNMLTGAIFIKWGIAKTAAP